MRVTLQLIALLKTDRTMTHFTQAGAPLRDTQMYVHHLLYKHMHWKTLIHDPRLDWGNTTYILACLKVTG
ncbi:hypothetical protein EXN66_Car008535 [Channa argus]|uniref:Uncharacterized protein n=1 Tax=Channa argus TaxID=215402 RepID=A0A6G1PRK9_CHAAH|nr:hypothetical protein EXN66_Car008535 [Channa argus]